VVIQNEWEMRTLGTVATYINGRAFKPLEWETNGLPIIRIQNLTNDNAKYNYSSKEHEEKYRVKNGDLLFAWSASLGAHIWKYSDAWLNQHIFKVIPNDDINGNYLYYYLLVVVSDLYAKTHGSGMVHITKAPFMATEIPVPPLAEQERIVTRLEELFSQLDNGVETLQTIKQQLKVYRQAVMKEAFEGRLTVKWRSNNTDSFIDDYWKNICELKQASGNNQKFQQDEAISLATLPQNWKWVSIGDITSGVEYGTSQKSLKQGKVPVVRMGNIQNGTIDWADLAYSNDDAEIEKYLLSKNDVLFNRTNSPELVGKTAIYRGERKSIFAGYLIRINQFDCINAEYLTYYLNSYTAKNYGNKVKTDGVNQSNINGKKLCSYPFPLCTFEEQKQVVFEIESRLSVCDNVEQTVDTALQQAEALRQSILKEAFKGRLS
jgi:type I restriction enzyme S subunit